MTKPIEVMAETVIKLYQRDGTVDLLDISEARRIRAQLDAAIKVHEAASKEWRRLCVDPESGL